MRPDKLSLLRSPPEGIDHASDIGSDIHSLVSAAEVDVGDPHSGRFPSQDVEGLDNDLQQILGGIVLKHGSRPATGARRGDKSALTGSGNDALGTITLDPKKFLLGEGFGKKESTGHAEVAASTGPKISGHNLSKR